MRESTLQAQILQKIGCLEWLRVWRNNTGMAWMGNRVEKPFKPTTITVSPGDVVIRQARPVRFGAKGSPDILGLDNDGRFVSIEVKTPTGRQSKEQQNFEKMVKTQNGIYILARSADDVFRGLGVSE